VTASLQQLDGRTFITDGGMETVLIFHKGLELPFFASFVLLDDEAGTEALREYFRRFIAIAREHGTGILLDTPTWRASPDWGERLGYSRDRLAELNRHGVTLLEDLRAESGSRPELLISGCIGPRGDGYVVGGQMIAGEAERYHSFQAEVFADTAADAVSALTMNYAEEAIGVVRAVEKTGIPVVVSFTVETDGRLPSGQELGEAIEQVDAETGGAAAYFMLNCAHPTHFAGTLDPDAPWITRLRGIRANASKLSHAELDEAETLDEGDPAELAAAYRDLSERLPALSVFGGCCGTDHRHIEAICAAVTP
jgi:S-methylmethionine-dependent homocysteine/selenocysteine methylase